MSREWWSKHNNLRQLLKQVDIDLFTLPILIIVRLDAFLLILNLFLDLLFPVILLLFPLPYFPYGKNDNAYAKHDVVNNVEVVQEKLKEQPVCNSGDYILAVLSVLQKLEMDVNRHEDVVEKRAVNHTNAYAYIGSFLLETKDIVNEFAYIPHMLDYK